MSEYKDSSTVSEDCSDNLVLVQEVFGKLLANRTRVDIKMLFCEPEASLASRDPPFFPVFFNTHFRLSAPFFLPVCCIEKNFSLLSYVDFVDVDVVDSRGTKSRDEKRVTNVARSRLVPLA